jgi:hypothetical protein
MRTPVTFSEWTCDEKDCGASAGDWRLPPGWTDAERDWGYEYFCPRHSARRRATSAKADE